MENPYLTKSIYKQAIKIKPIQIYTKIQEAKPIHYSNLINKELGYDVIIQLAEGEEPYKLFNCISSARPNSQLFKRFCKNLLFNMRNDIDQLFFFTSNNPATRLQTSIGLQTNPGIFLIVGLTFLDQKYKYSYHKCDIEFSFLQFKEGQIYDLLCYTGQPLLLQRDQTDENYLNFKEHWVKTTTFNQFIKLFKIALFNNKDRDFKSQNTSIKCRSTFIMKIKSKLYNQKEQLIKQHQTVLIDFQQNHLKEVSLNGKQKTASKSPLDYILIQMHNANPNKKPISYHLVQENYLLLLIRKYLKRNPVDLIEASQEQKKQHYVAGQITIINSFPADKTTFKASHSYLQNIIANLGESWEAKVLPKTRTLKTIDRIYLQNQLSSISQSLSDHTFTSLRNFDAFKQQLIGEVKKFKQQAKQFGKIIQSYMRQKSQLRFLQNQLVAYQKKYVGGCIKSDNFKDFYNARSYLMLQREIKIKTESVKEQICVKSQLMANYQKKYLNLKRKWHQNYQKYKQQIKQQVLQPKIHLQTSNSYNSMSFATKSANDIKFKKIHSIKTQNNQLQQIRNLISHLYEYLSSFWDRVNLSDQRTVRDSIQLEEIIAIQSTKMSQIIDIFIKGIGAISQTDIMCEQQNNLFNSNQLALFRSLNFLGMIGPKKMSKGLQIGKRILLSTKSTKVPQKQTKKSKIAKLPSILSTQNIVITGDINLSQLLTNPSQNNLLFNNS